MLWEGRNKYRPTCVWPARKKKKIDFHFQKCLNAKIWNQTRLGIRSFALRSFALCCFAVLLLSCFALLHFCSFALLLFCSFHFFEHKSDSLFMKELFTLFKSGLGFFWRENRKLDLYHTCWLRSGSGIRSFALLLYCSFALSLLSSFALSLCSLF